MKYRWVPSKPEELRHLDDKAMAVLLLMDQGKSGTLGNEHLLRYLGAIEIK